MKYGTAKKIICFFVMGVILVALVIEVSRDEFYREKR